MEHAVKLMSEALEITVPLFNPDAALTNQDEELLDEEAEIQHQHLLVESEWIQQERFNIQEAFTNQTKKIQADYQAFIDQLDAEFIVERQKILVQTLPEITPQTQTKSPDHRQKANAAQLNRQFKSNAKRNMLVQTAPVLELQNADRTKDVVSKPRGESSKSVLNDMTPTNRQLQELEQRLDSFKETAETQLKDSMQWIARQCAHMFTQLDCKEAEAELVLLLTEQNTQGAQRLLRRVDAVASLLRASIHEYSGQLPQPPSLQSQQPAATDRPHSKSSLAPVAAPLKAQRRDPRRRSEPVGLK